MRFSFAITYLGRVLVFLALLSPVFSSYETGVKFYQMKRFKDAMKNFKASVEAKKDVGDSFYYMASILYHEKMYPKSYRYFLLSYKNGCKLPDLPLRLGSTLDKLKTNLSYPDFLKQVRTPYDKKVYPIPVVYQLIRFHQNRGEYTDIIKIFDKVENDPSFQIGQNSVKGLMGLIYYYVGISYKSEENQSKAFEMASKSLGFDPNNSEAKSLHTDLVKLQSRDLKTWLRRAREAFLKKEFDEAERNYKKVLSLRPDEDVAREGLNTNNLARTSYEKSAQAEKLFKQGEHEKALKTVKFALAAYSDNFEAKNLRKEIESVILKKLKLSNQVEQAKKNEEKEYFSLLSQASNANSNNQFDQAVELYTKALSLRPDSQRAKRGIEDAKKGVSVQMVYQKGMDHFKKKQYGLALKEFLEVKKSEIFYSGMDQNIIECQFFQKNFKEVVRLAEDMLAMRPEEKSVIYFLARSYEEAGEDIPDSHQMAIDNFSKLITLDPGYADASDRLGRLQKQKIFPIIVVLTVLGVVIFIVVWFFRTRKDRQKYKFLNRVEKLARKDDWSGIVKLYGEFYMIDLNMQETLRTYPVFMQALIEEGRYEECLKIGPKVLSAMPNHRQAQVFMGKALYKQGNMNPNVIKYYLALFESDFVDEEMIKWVGERVMDLKMVREETLPLIKEYNKLFPEHEGCRKLLLEYLDKEKTLSKQTIELMEMEAKFNPNDVRCRLRLAEYYLGRKQYDTCIRFCEEVINLNVTERKLHEILYAAYEAQGNLETLLPVYESLLQLFPNSISLQEAQNKILLATGRQGLSQVQLNAMQQQNQED